MFAVSSLDEFLVTMLSPLMKFAGIVNVTCT